MTTPLQESTPLAEATTKADATKGLLEVEFITPGWGSSGYYSRAVVENAQPLFAAGTHMYLDHPTAEDDQKRPGRSVKDLVAVIKESSVNPTTGAIRGKVKPFGGPYRDLLLDEDFAKTIGLSIRGNASAIIEGEAEGKAGPIVQSLEEIKSVDFVTRAGRGGKVLQVLESAREVGTDEQVNRRAVAHGVEEATADERRQQLSDAVRTAYGSTRRYAWVQDFDDSTVWFQASDEAERSRVWEQSYTVNDGDMAVTLTGARTEVRQVTRYLPITTTVASTENAPTTGPGSSTTTEESKETKMGNVSIEESEHQRLVSEAAKVEELRTENTTLREENTTLKEAKRVADREGKARGIIAEAKIVYNDLEMAGVLATLPLTQEGDLDEVAFKTKVAEHKAQLQESAGAGRVSGFGSLVDALGDESADPATLREESDKVRRGAFGRTSVKEA